MNWFKFAIVLSATACSVASDDIGVDSGDTSDEYQINTINLPGNICQVAPRTELTREEFLYVVRLCMSEQQSILPISSLITADGHTIINR
jgi:hypothetical protein